MGGKNYDVAVIGSGPGGYVASIRCAQLGLKTAIVEKNKTLGGTCLNVGCIPAKALLDSTELLSTARHKMKSHGIIIDSNNIKVDLARMMARKDQIIGRMTEGVKLLLANNRVDIYEGKGRLKDKNTVIIKGGDLKETEITCGNIILATGSVPMELSIMPFDHDKITDSTDALSFKEIPERLAVIGAGAVGLELGCVWSRLGTDVIIIELMDQILPQADTHSADRLTQILKKQGLDFRLSARVISADIREEKVRLILEKMDKTQEDILCDRVLVSAGRRPNIEDLGLDEMGIKYDAGKRHISVNNKYQSSVPNIYAIGDIIHGPMLAHKAEDEGIAVSEIIAGGFGSVNYNTIPSIVYTWPEYASAGKNENRLKAEGISYKIGVFQFRANGRALATENTEGFVKIFAEEKTDRLLGAEIIGPWASELIVEIVSVMEFEGNAEDIARTIHAHPTLSEVLREASMDAAKWSIHSLPKLTRSKDS